MAAVDQVNTEHGKGTTQVAASGVPEEREGTMERRQKSLRYTTRWNESPVAKAEEAQ